MPNAILIHSTGGSPGEVFYPWLRRELEAKGYKVYAPAFPTPGGQTLDSWMKAFEPYWQYVNHDTIFVGRSIGPVFILRLLEKSPVKVKAAFLIAGFCSDLGLDEFRPLIDSFLGSGFNLGKISKSCKKFFVYNSDNDRFIPIEKGEELAKNLHTRVRLVKGADHFFMSKFPQLLEDINSL